MRFQGLKWSRVNPASLPIKSPTYLPDESRNQPHISYVIRFWVNQYLAVSRMWFLFDRILFGQDLERQILLVTNPHLRPYQRQRLYEIISSTQVINKVPTSHYLRQLVDYQPKMTSEMLHAITMKYEEPKVMLAVTQHHNTSEETKVIAGLKLGE